MCSGREPNFVRAGPRSASSRFLPPISGYSKRRWSELCNGRAYGRRKRVPLGSRYQRSRALSRRLLQSRTPARWGTIHLAKRSPAGDGSITSSATTTCREPRLARQPTCATHRSTSGVWGSVTLGRNSAGEDRTVKTASRARSIRERAAFTLQRASRVGGTGSRYDAKQTAFVWNG